MTTPTLLITPRRPALLAGHDNEIDVLVRIQAPASRATPAARAPLHLALVIDRSGSMSGQPLEQAKRCAEFIVDGLQPTDRLSLVTYDDGVDTLVPAMPLFDKDHVRQAIRRIASGGSTDLHGGWLRGAETLAPYTRDDLTSRVILLSDGCANAGLTEDGAIFAQCDELARAGVTTSTYGVGNGFNEELMIGMARHGRGRSYYGQTAEDLMDPFREEFALLNALCARRLQLELRPAPGVQAKLLNDYPSAGTDGHRWLLPDLAEGAEAWAVLRLRVSQAAATGVAHEGMRALGTFAVRYSDLEGVACELPGQALALPTLPVAAFHAIAEDELVIRRTDELEAAQLQMTARSAARRRDWAAVDTALRHVERIASRNPWVAESVAELRGLAAMKDEERFAKESAYAAERMSTRLAASVEACSAKLEGVVPAYVRRKAAQGKAQKPAR